MHYVLRFFKRKNLVFFDSELKIKHISLKKFIKFLLIFLTIETDWKFLRVFNLFRSICDTNSLFVASLKYGIMFIRNNLLTGKDISALKLINTVPKECMWLIMKTNKRETQFIIIIICFSLR